MPANFADRLRIDANGHLAPSGPSKIVQGETEVEFYIWVQQPSAFMHCEAELDAAGTAWIMKPGSAEHKGRFVPGPAVGTGMQTGELDGKVTTFWWGEQIELI